MSAPANTPWTDERVKTLRRMWADGHTAKAIAQHFRCISRNAVIGKLGRLGLLGSDDRRTPQPHAPRKPVQRRKVPKTVIATLEAVFAAPEPPVARHEPSTTLANIRSNQCHWPIGEPKGRDTEYCGAPKPLGASYCAYHRRLAYQPRKRREAAA